MARDIVIISTSKAQDGTVTLNAVLWLTTPAILVKADATRKSQATGIAVNPTTAPELAAIQAGTITEQLYNVTAPSGSTGNQVAAILLNGLNAAQTALNALAPSHDYTGSSHDGVSGWTVV